MAACPGHREASTSSLKTERSAGTAHHAWFVSEHTGSRQAPTGSCGNASPIIAARSAASSPAVGTIAARSSGATWVQQCSAAKRGSPPTQPNPPGALGQLLHPP